MDIMVVCVFFYSVALGWYAYMYFSALIARFLSNELILIFFSFACSLFSILIWEHESRSNASFKPTSPSVGHRTQLIHHMSYVHVPRTIHIQYYSVKYIYNIDCIKSEHWIQFIASCIRLFTSFDYFAQPFPSFCIASNLDGSIEIEFLFRMTTQKKNMPSKIIPISHLMDSKEKCVGSIVAATRTNPE